jgi:hypothetical protein
MVAMMLCPLWRIQNLVLALAVALMMEGWVVVLVREVAVMVRQNQHH